MSIGSALLGAVLATALVTTAGVASSVPLGPGSERPTVRPSGVSRWAWPLDPHPEVARPFDRPDQPWLAGHRGVDLAATVGQSVLAPTAGRLSWSGMVAGRPVVVVTHDNGLRSTFEPVAATAVVGSSVTRGQAIGTVTSEPGHCAPRTCLHWGVRRGETYLDPLAYVGRPPVILLPVP